MHIYVDKRLAVLKKGTSFEYVSENRLFSGSDGYTLTITFPLRGCDQNIAIFGNINRADVEAQKVIFDCEIRDRGFYKFGSITVTEISETEVKTQFLEGRSEQNFDKTFDKVYINELDLGQWPTDTTASIQPYQAWDPNRSQNKYVALPWVNDYSGNIQNCTTFKPREVVSGVEIHPDRYVWHEDCRGLSWQPYLLWITKQICAAIGYDIDLSEWEASEQFRWIIICNTLPHAWYVKDFARALPHWTVEEYFAKLELFMNCEFDIDHRFQTIRFAFSAKRVAALRPVCIEDVIEEHSVEIRVEEQSCDYIEAKNLVYKDRDDESWKLESCDWYIKGLLQSRVETYSDMQALMNATRSYRTWNGSSGRSSFINKIFYVTNLDMYFILRAVNKTLVQKNKDRPNRYSYDVILQPINSFGGRIVDDSEDAKQEEIEFVPVRIEHTDMTYGHCMFLSFSGYDEFGSENSGFSWKGFEEHKKEQDETFYNSQPYNYLKSGKKEKASEYYDRIYIAYWDGATMPGGLLQRPYTEDVVILPDWSGYFMPHLSLRINCKLSTRRGKVYNIEPKVKKTFKFLSDTIPNVRSLFLIRGKRYLCEKITATFTENGMSQLIKGVFYPIKD